MSGTVVIDGNAGNGAAASIRGGTVVVHGDAAARAGVSMKGGLLLIGGNCGYMAGFMMQKGRIIVCGDAGDALADSMYEGVVFVGGEIAALGNDAVVSDASDAELAEIRATLAHHGLDGPRSIPEDRVRAQAVELRQEGHGNMEGGALRPLRPSQIYRPEVIEDIQAKAELGRYRIRGFGTLRPRPLGHLRRSHLHPLLAHAHPARRLPRECSTKTVLGTRYAKKPIELDIPVMITGMSWGALSYNAKVALAQGARAAGTSTTTGDGGMLPAERENSRVLIYEVLPEPLRHQRPPPAHRPTPSS